MMTGNDLFNALNLMAKMVSDIHNGTEFVEVSTYVKNNIPNLSPSVIEMFRDIIYPIQHKIFHKGRYEVIGRVGDLDVIKKSGLDSTFAAEQFIEDKTEEGFKNIAWRIYYR